MATWIVGGALALTVAGVVFKLVRDAKSGKHSCGGDCSRCHANCQHRPS